MWTRLSRAVLIVGTSLFVGTGCGSTEPYLYVADEFDRESPTFRVQPIDREALVVCYNGVVTSDEAVTAVAAQECARYGKQARRVSTSAGDCPIAVLLEAHFTCVAP